MKKDCGQYPVTSKASQPVPVDLRTVADNDYSVLKVAMDPAASGTDVFFGIADMPFRNPPTPG